MPRASANPMMRALIVLFGVMAGILAFAIYIAANSPTHARVEAAANEEKNRAEGTRQEAASSEDQTQAAEARKEAAEHLKSLGEANADLRKQLELAKADLRQQAEKLAGAERKACGCGAISMRP